MKISSLICAGITVLILGSCASSYHSIQPRNLYYAGTTNYDGVDFAYQYDVLSQAGNRKYAKKEEKKGMQVVAVKLTNNTGRSLSFRDDISIYAGDVPANLIAPEIITQQVKQSVPIYSLYLLLSFVKFYTHDAYGQITSTTPIGLFIGPPIAAINMITAGSANNNFKTELVSNNLLNRTIADGETVYGLISIPKNGYRPLSLKVNTSISEKVGGY